MAKTVTASVSLLIALGVAACEPEDAATPTTDGVVEAAASPEEVQTVEAEVTAQSAMEVALNGDWRVAPERDEWRNPARTLAFFGVEPDMTVVEIWPGGGWYTSILGPYLKQGGGKLVAAGFDTSSSDFAKRRMDAFNETFVANPDVYGEIEVTVASKEADGFATPASVDVVLTFRNVHNWMGREYADKMFMDAFNALKPGGVLGVVEHRLPSADEQDPTGRSGYVQEALVIQLAKEAGFEFDGSSEVNANPADTADHPFGVWTLPPSSRTADRDGNTPEGFDPEAYQLIGESDRMTLKFIKPSE